MFWRRRISSDFASKGMPGFANWMSIQFKEEQDHAMKFFNYMVSRGARPILKPIEKVQTHWDSPLAMFEDTLAHERVVTKLINDIYSLAQRRAGGGDWHRGARVRLANSPGLGRGRL